MRVARGYGPHTHRAGALVKRAVRDAFVDFTVPLEGRIPWLYADVKGLVTIAIGNLVDPISLALGLPLRHPDGRLATRDEIAAEWQRVKSDPHAAAMGHKYAQRITRLRLDDKAIAMLVLGKLDANDTALRARFPEFEEWPADAQLATHSMAWACGPAFRFPRLERALREQDWEIAAVECRMDERGNPGLVPRNRLNRQLYRNAHNVVARRLDPDVLYLPRDLDKEPPELDGALAPDEYRAEGPAPIVRLMLETVQRCDRCGLVSCDGSCPEAA